MPLIQKLTRKQTLACHFLSGYLSVFDPSVKLPVVEINKDFYFLQFVDIGIVTSIEVNHKQVDVARKGQEVCIKIEPIPGESPKMYGRHFEATDFLVSKV